MMQEKARVRQEAEADEIISRLKYPKPKPKYIILTDNPVIPQFWIKYKPDEKQTISEEETAGTGSRRDYGTASCPICEAEKKIRS